MWGCVLFLAEAAWELIKTVTSPKATDVPWYLRLFMFLVALAMLALLILWLVFDMI